MTDTPAAPDISTMTPASRGPTLAQCRLTLTHRHRLLQQPQRGHAHGSIHSPPTRSGAHVGSRAACAERREYQRLTELADQADEVKDAIAGTTPEPNLIETVGPGELSTRDRASPSRCFAMPDSRTKSSQKPCAAARSAMRAEFMAAKALQECSARRSRAGVSSGSPEAGRRTARNADQYNSASEI